jgi:hypothetical protein
MLRWLLLGGVLLGLTTLLIGRPPTVPRKGPRLLVLVVFDQMRGDYLTRWDAHHAPDGFRRLLHKGAWYSQCHYPYAATMTGPGHSSLLTGATPAVHGIIANEWYDRKESAEVYCASHPRFTRVPPAPPPEKPDKPTTPKDQTAEELPPLQRKVGGAGAPVRLLAPTLGDLLKSATHGQSKVIGLSLKDRSALLPAGQCPDGAYWFDTADGMFVTSNYYRDRLPKWLTAFNQSGAAKRWHNQTWTRLHPDLDYTPLSGPDDSPGESKGANQGIKFPHPYNEAGKPANKKYYEALTCSPAGNDLLLDVVRLAIRHEKLGADDVPDLLNLSFSSNDLVGHAWGPDSQEVMDITLRSDLIVRDLLKLLDEQVGAGNYLLALSADHGICPLPEWSQRHGHPDAVRINAVKLLIGAETHLRGYFGHPHELTTRWIEGIGYPWIYVNERVCAARHIPVAEVARELAKWLSEQEGLTAYDRAQLTEPSSDPVRQKLRASFHPDRAGDVAMVLRPYCLLGTSLTGTTHGTPHPYDTYVPLVFYGTGVTPGERREVVPPQIIAAVLAQAVGLPPPAFAEYGVPSSWTKAP